jgi:hypothetical protein
MLIRDGEGTCFNANTHVHSHWSNISAVFQLKRTNQNRNFIKATKQQQKYLKIKIAYDKIS